MSNSKEEVKFYKGFSKNAEKEIREIGPRFMSANGLAQLAPVRDLVALALLNGVLRPDSEPGRLDHF
jgi:hypothetical protein